MPENALLVLRLFTVSKPCCFLCVKNVYVSLERKTRLVYERPRGDVHTSTQSSNSQHSVLYLLWAIYPPSPPLAFVHGIYPLCLNTLTVFYVARD